MSQPHAPYDLVKTMRASFYVLGPLLSRFHESKYLFQEVVLEDEPVDFHIKATNECRCEIR